MVATGNAMYLGLELDTDIGVCYELIKNGPQASEPRITVYICALQCPLDAFCLP